MAGETVDLVVYWCFVSSCRSSMVRRLVTDRYSGTLGCSSADGLSLQRLLRQCVGLS
jgi:hypothetical protein